MNRYEITMKKRTGQLVTMTAIGHTFGAALVAASAALGEVPAYIKARQA